MPVQKTGFFKNPSGSMALTRVFMVIFQIPDIKYGAFKIVNI